MTKICGVYHGVLTHEASSIVYKTGALKGLVPEYYGLFEVRFGWICLALQDWRNQGLICSESLFFVVSLLASFVDVYTADVDSQFHAAAFRGALLHRLQ